MKKTPATSEGARYERKAFRSMLRRRLANLEAGEVASAPSQITDTYKELIDWVIDRQKRYDKKAGGL